MILKNVVMLRTGSYNYLLKRKQSTWEPYLCLFPLQYVTPIRLVYIMFGKVYPGLLKDIKYKGVIIV